MDGTRYINTNNKIVKKGWIFPVIIITLFTAWLISNKGIIAGVILTLIPFIIFFLIVLFKNPKIGILSYIVYSFCIHGLGKHIAGLEVGLGEDILLFLTWLGIIFNRTSKYRLHHLNNDLVWLFVIWLIITLLEIVNPEHPSLAGWVFEMRAIILYQILSIPLIFFLLNKKKDLSLFINLFLIFSVIVALYGVKQLVIGPDAAEWKWLNEGARSTHILNGKLRIFSLYSEAAQYGSAMANVSIVCIILALGPYSYKTKTIYVLISLLTFYCMLTSGTRTSIFVILGGGIIYLFLSKKIRILIIGGIFGALFLSFLKFTTIGNSNSQISRLRTSLDPTDPSFQVRLHNQEKLKIFLLSRPFGAGVGVIGNWGLKYNPEKFISTIPPDSLYVKIWAMYGIVGFLIWMGFMSYIIGKTVGIIWTIRDPVLKNKLSALCAGAAGIFLCSYGNEIMNQMPSLMIVYVSWALIWISPRWDTPLPKSITL